MVKPRADSTWLLASTLLTAAMAGCSGSNLGAEVNGHVTLDGKPVGPGVVVLAPADGKSNPPEGAIQPDGSYFLKTSREVGLVPGNYSAAVSVYNSPEVKAGERSTVPPKLVTPEEYSSLETSDLKYEVKPGNNTIDIDLKSK